MEPLISGRRYIAFTVAYRGTRFCGSQIQANGRTVQGDLEAAVARIFREPCRAILAGRTDSGVHATGQVARIETQNLALPVERVARALNGVLERDVRVLEAWQVDEGFHPRFSAKSRIYQYRILVSRQPNPLLQEIAAPLGEELDVEAMQRASLPLLGRKDFAAWQSAGSPAPSTIREVKQVKIWRSESFGSRLIEIEIEADAFLYQMVRNIVGALIEAGRGQITSEDVRVLTEGLDRKLCPPPALPQGLCLVQVNY